MHNALPKPGREAMCRPSASVVTVGDELVCGDVIDTNGAEAARRLIDHGYRIRARHCVPDEKDVIVRVVRDSLSSDGVLIVIGGLGPTSDDVTRFAVAQAMGRSLVHCEEAWQAVVQRLTAFDLPIHEDNRRQALMPAGARPLPNHNGTAWGVDAQLGPTRLVMLPGPPQEFRPMLDAAFGEAAGGGAALTWRTLGLVEADLAAKVDALVARHPEEEVTTSFRRHYPFVDMKLRWPRSASPAMEEQIDAVLEGHVVSRKERTAVQELAEVLDRRPFTVDDRLTGGSLPCVLESMRAGADRPESGEAIHVALEGQWSSGARFVYTGSLTLRCLVNQDVYTMTLPNRGPEAMEAAVEFAAWSLVRALSGAQEPSRDVVNRAGTPRPA